MPLNNSYDEQEVIKAIATALETFYANSVSYTHLTLPTNSRV